MQNVQFRTHDPRLLEIILHRSRYIDHIWPNHPMVEIDDIQSTVDDPELIMQDERNQNVENYYKQEVIAEYPDLYLKVCVLFKSADEGRVITAFPVPWPKPEEEIIWQK